MLEDGNFKSKIDAACDKVIALLYKHLEPEGFTNEKIVYNWPIITPIQTINGGENNILLIY